MIGALGGSATLRRPLPRERRPRAAPARVVARASGRRCGCSASGRPTCSRSPASYGSFPIILETYRECLRDVFDLPALRGGAGRHPLAAGAGGERRDGPSASPFAAAPRSSTTSASYMYEGDAPLAERRAQALTLDRELLAELLGRRRAARAPRSRRDRPTSSSSCSRSPADGGARTVDGVHDLLRRVGDLPVDEVAARVADLDAGGGAAGARGDRGAPSPCASPARSAGSPSRTSRATATHWGSAHRVASPRPGSASRRRTRSSAAPALGAHARPVHGGSPRGAVGNRPDHRGGAHWHRWSPMAAARGRVPAGRRPTTSYADPEVLRALRRRSLARLRREVEPVPAEALARFLPAWHGIGSRAGGLDRLLEVVAQLEGAPIPASILERDVLRARVRDYAPRLLDELGAAGEVVWVGRGSLGRDDGRVALYRRDRAAPASAGAVEGQERPAGEIHESIRAQLARRGASFFAQLRGAAPGVRSDDELLDALWDLVWAGEVTNDTFAPLRALTLPRSRSRARPRRRPLHLPRAAARRRSLVAGRRPRRRVAAPPTERGARHGVSLLERHGCPDPGGRPRRERGRRVRAVYPVLRAMEEAGRARRGYFVDGLGAAQFALPGAVDRLRAARDPIQDDGPQVAAGRRRPRPALRRRAPVARRNDEERLPLQRAAGAYVVLVDGAAVLYLERGGKSSSPCRPVRPGARRDRRGGSAGPPCPDRTAPRARIRARGPRAAGRIGAGRRAARGGIPALVPRMGPAVEHASRRPPHVNGAT